MVPIGPVDDPDEGVQELLDKGALVIIGALLLFAPALLIVVTMGFLQLIHGMALSDLTPLELVELYLIEMALLAAFAYAVYRILRWSTRHRLPAALDSLETEADDDPDRRD
ncbi:hypothetical protein ACKVMT_00160 [Halobacteriales archaeon Cl-PHB]